jgi:hypothetical protein
MPRIASVSLVLALLVVSGISAHDGHDDGLTEQTFKIGKNGEVKFGEDVTIGDLLVKKGRYLLEHRLDGERHLFMLTSAERAEAKAAPVYEVPTEVLVSKVPVKKSAVYAAERDNHMLQVTVVQIAGENVNHLPRTTTTAITH